ncbi:lecithin retinol acyltransferase b, tandem duplicate 2 [Aulostomus maculatus]
MNVDVTSQRLVSVRGPSTQGPGPRAQGSGLRAQDPGPRAQDPGPRTQDTGHRTQGSAPSFHASFLTRRSCAMFPLQLLALLYISAPAPEPEDPAHQEDEDTDGLRDSEADRRLRRGDLLEVPRTLFTHFGIYLGEGRVAHFIPDIMPVVSRDHRRIRRMVTNSRLLLGVLAKRGSVRVDSVEDFAYGSKILINTSDQVCSCPALCGDEVAMRAEKLCGDVSYSLLWYNCEHFVMYCRYGTAMSFQTFQFCKTVRKLVLSRRVAKVMAVLGVCVLLSLRVVSASAALLAVVLPFLIWMAS